MKLIWTPETKNRIRNKGTQELNWFGLLACLPAFPISIEFGLPLRRQLRRSDHTGGDEA